MVQRISLLNQSLDDKFVNQMNYYQVYFDLNFYDPGQSFASYQFMDGKITFQSSGGRIVTGVIGGQYRENFNATGLKFSLNASGNYTRYYFNTYGIANSGS